MIPLSLKIEHRLLSQSAFGASFVSVGTSRNDRQQKFLASPRRRVSPAAAALEPFDFSSRRGWDDFYHRRGEKSEDDEGGEAFEYEWHPSIPHSSIISELEPGCSCLMLGCGNSALPADLYDAHGGRTRVYSLDYSSVCVEAMRELHGSDRPGMSFVCADALKLDETDISGLCGDAESDAFDVVVDKGLVDALMCGEAWDYDVSRLFRGVSEVLRKDGGLYILVSFKLAQSTKDFLQEEGGRHGFKWDFDINSKSNNGVSFSIGRRRA